MTLEIANVLSYAMCWMALNTLRGASARQTLEYPGVPGRKAFPSLNWKAPGLHRPFSAYFPFPKFGILPGHHLLNSGALMLPRPCLPNKGSQLITHSVESRRVKWEHLCLKKIHLETRQQFSQRQVSEDSDIDFYV